MNLAQIINTWMESPEQNRWVPSVEIEQKFDVDERIFRAHRDKPGILSETCVSSELGFKHLRHTNIKERIAFKNKFIRVKIAAIRKLRWYGIGLTRVKTHNPVPMELKTGQTLLLP